MTGLAVVAGEWRFAAADRALLNTRFLPWALRAGARAPDLMCIYYERHFDESLEELRLRWRLETAPAAPQNAQRPPRLLRTELSGGAAAAAKGGAAAAGEAAGEPGAGEAAGQPGTAAA
jgi:ubiquinone biosynthesis protein COQ4